MSHALETFKAKKYYFKQNLSHFKRNVHLPCLQRSRRSELRCPSYGPRTKISQIQYAYVLTLMYQFLLLDLLIELHIFLIMKSNTCLYQIQSSYHLFRAVENMFNKKIQLRSSFTLYPIVFTSSSHVYLGAKYFLSFKS